jgi:hypothetical protein
MFPVLCRALQRVTLLVPAVAVAACQVAGTGTAAHVSATPSTEATLAATATTAGPPAATALPTPSAVPAGEPEVAVGDGDPWILYQHQTEPGGFTVIRLVRPDGSDDHAVLPTELADLDAAHPAWSPDGSTIVFEVWDDAGLQPAIELWTVGADGAGARRLAGCDGEPCRQLAYPAYSPDGTRLAFLRYDMRPDGDWGPSHLEVLEIATGDRTTVARSRDGLRGYYMPRWSPDGTAIVVVVEAYSDERQATVTSRRLAVVPVMGARRQLKLITPDTFSASAPDWAPSDRIAFTRSTGMTDVVATASIATVAPDGSDLRDVTPAGGGDGIEPTWLQDGRLMYVGYPDRRMRLVTSHADGSNSVVADWVLRGPSGVVVRTHATMRPVP